MPSFNSTRCISAFIAFVIVQTATAQDIEPRRWSHLPLGSNFGGMAYAYTEGDIFLNPVLRIEDGEFEMHTAAFGFSYIGIRTREDIGSDNDTFTIACSFQW